MCGIAGIFEPDLESCVDIAVLQRMADTLRHRGPDDGGVYSNLGVGLAHRRLSIIDVHGGHQPLTNEDGTIWIAFNGEIYNFEDLNRQYLSSGHRFRTHSDTETIVHLYEELGEECFAQLRGMFALAIWDSRRRRLLLARDRIGKKPLFYSWNGSRLVFGSEIKALLEAGGVSREMDMEAAADYFSLQYVPAPKTIYRSVRKLEAAHYMVVENRSARKVRYWDIRLQENGAHSEAEWCERLMAEYRAAVRMRLISDVPLGAFLSAGVDSSSVVAVMNEIQSPVTTCSIGFTEQKYSEAPEARQFAEGLGANHFEHIVRPQVADLIPRLAWHYDEPFADSSAVPTYYVSQVARRHVTVALSGDGGDENFAGYRRYNQHLQEDRLRSLLPPAVRSAVFGTLGALYPKLGWAPRILRAKSTFQSLSRESIIDGYFCSSPTCPPGMRTRLFSPELLRQLNGYHSSEVFRYHYDRAGTRDPLSRLQYVDMKTYLPDDILVKVDRASMANSLEVRCPLLDHKLMELIATMPPTLKLNGTTGKYIFKQALRSVLPGSVLNRRKQGFETPVAEWFRGELKEFAHATLFDRHDDLLNRPFLTSCWKQHQRGQRDWSALLWCVLMFRSWQEVYKAA